MPIKVIRRTFSIQIPGEKEIQSLFSGVRIESCNAPTWALYGHR